MFILDILVLGTLAFFAFSSLLCAKQSMYGERSNGPLGSIVVACVFVLLIFLWFC
jgi:hypothetical protein